MTTVADLWKMILEDMREDISSIALSTWFDEVVPVRAENGQMHLYCPNSFKKSTILQFYLQTVEKCLTKRFSAPFEAIFLSDEEYTAICREKEEGARKGARYTFDTFVVGESNRVAYDSALAVVQGRNEFCNPLVIYGTPGLGKTHLLRAIEEQAKKNLPQEEVVFLRGDEFTNDLIDAIRNHATSQFREKYRNASVFLMDDIQFIEGKERTQEEFYNTFDTLCGNGCSIVIALDRPLWKMNRLEERIRSRFEGGLVAEITEPDAETRLAIVERKAAERGLELQERDARYIAEHVTGSVRQLEGVLNSIKAANRAVPETRLVEETVRRMVGQTMSRETPEEIVDRVSRAFGVDPAQVRGKAKSRGVSQARQAAMYILCRGQGLSANGAGKLFDRDHTTVLYALKSVDKKLQSDPAFADALEKLMPENYKQ